MKYKGKITDPKDLTTKEYVDTGVESRQQLIKINEFPEELVDDALYRVETEFEHEGKTYEVGLYQVSGEDIIKIGSGGGPDPSNLKTVDGKSLVGTGDISVGVKLESTEEVYSFAGGRIKISEESDGINMSAFAYGAGKFIAFEISEDRNGKIYYSEDLGETWSVANIDGENGYYSTNFGADNSVCYSGEKFIAVLGGNEVLESNDGINWTVHYGAFPVNMAETISYGNGKFVATWWGDQGTFYYSTDGINWNKYSAESGSPVQYFNFTYGTFCDYEDGRFVFLDVGSGDIAYTEDLENFTVTTYTKEYGSPNKRPLFAKKENGESVLTLVSSYDKVVYNSYDCGESFDGYTDIQGGTYHSGYLRTCAAYKDYMILAEDFEAKGFYTSTDLGRTWTYRDYTFGNELWNIIYGGGRIIGYIRHSGPYINFAENVSVAKQDGEDATKTIEKAVNGIVSPVREGLKSLEQQMLHLPKFDEYVVGSSGEVLDMYDGKLLLMKERATYGIENTYRGEDTGNSIFYRRTEDWQFDYSYSEREIVFFLPDPISGNNNEIWLPLGMANYDFFELLVTKGILEHCNEEENPEFVVRNYSPAYNEGDNIAYAMYQSWPIPYSATYYTLMDGWAADEVNNRIYNSEKGIEINLANNNADSLEGLYSAIFENASPIFYPSDYYDTDIVTYRDRLSLDGDGNPMSFGAEIVDKTKPELLCTKFQAVINDGGYYKKIDLRDLRGE